MTTTLRHRLPGKFERPRTDPSGEGEAVGGALGRLRAVTRERPPADRLRRFAQEHLLYEAGMLYEVTGTLMNRRHRDDPVVENALLESFGVHSRNLIDFLWRDRPMWDTDAKARDWIEGWEAPEKSDRLEGVADRVGKEMFHLSYNRLDIPEDEKGWEVLGTGPEVIGAFTKFVTEVPDDLVPEGWREHAYDAIGAVTPEQQTELEQQLIRPEDMRPPDLPSVPTQGLPPNS
jgi:hypothetical protein